MKLDKNKCCLTRRLDISYTVAQSGIINTQSKTPNFKNKKCLCRLFGLLILLASYTLFLLYGYVIHVVMLVPFKGIS